MKIPLFGLIVFAFSALTPVVVHSQASKGLIIYKQFADSPDSTAKVEEFDHRMQRGATSLSFYPVGSQKQKLISNDQVAFLIEYPSWSAYTRVMDLPTLRNLTEEMKKAANRFPEATDSLKPHYLKAIEVAQRLGKGLEETLEVSLSNGAVKTFKTAKIDGYDSQDLIVSHLSGVTKIPLGELSDAELNKRAIPFRKLAMADGTERRFVPGKITGQTFDSLLVSGEAIPYEKLSIEAQKEYGFNKDEIEMERRRRETEKAAKLEEKRNQWMAESDKFIGGEWVRLTPSEELGLTPGETIEVRLNVKPNGNFVHVIKVGDEQQSFGGKWAPYAGNFADTNLPFYGFIVTDVDELSGEENQLLNMLARQTKSGVYIFTGQSIQRYINNKGNKEAVQEAIAKGDGAAEALDERMSSRIAQSQQVGTYDINGRDFVRLASMAEEQKETAPRESSRTTFTGVQVNKNQIVGEWEKNHDGDREYLTFKPGGIVTYVKHTGLSASTFVGTWRLNQNSTGVVIRGETAFTGFGIELARAYGSGDLRVIYGKLFFFLPGSPQSVDLEALDHSKAFSKISSGGSGGHRSGGSSSSRGLDRSSGLETSGGLGTSSGF